MSNGADEMGICCECKKPVVYVAETLTKDPVTGRTGMIPVKKQRCLRCAAKVGKPTLDTKG